MAKVLVVEDDRILNNAYHMILSKDGHTVDTAFDGQEALDKVDDLQPDIILLDLLMPGLDGISFLEQFSKRSTTKKPQVIVLSNMGDAKLVNQARDLGADKYIVKAHTTPGQLSLLIKRMGKTQATK